MRRLKLAQFDSNHTEKQRASFRSWLKKITVNHVSLVLGLLHYYDILSKAQHGSSTVNQLPWEFYDKVQVLEKKLAILSTTDDWPTLTKYKKELEVGTIEGVHIGTETVSSLRSTETFGLRFKEQVIKATEYLKLIAKHMSSQIKIYIFEPKLISCMRLAFTQWDEENCLKLIEVSKGAKGLWITRRPYW